MTVLASDTFQRSNVSSGWGTATDGESWSAVRGTPTWSVSSNEGLFTAQGGGTFTVAQLGSKTNGPQELLVRLKPSDTTSDIGLVARYVDSNNFYYATLSGHPIIGKDTSNSFSTLGTDNTFSYSSSNFYWLRFNLVGSTLKLRVWQDGNSEPSTWNVTVTDSDHSSGGFAVGSDANSQSQYDHFQVTDASVQKDIASRFRLLAVATKDIASRFRLLAVTSKDIASRFRLLAVATKDIASRFRLLAVSTKDIASRFRLQALATRDIASRFRLLAVSTRDVATRFRLLAVRTSDISARFRLLSVAIKDIAARYRLQATATKDLSGRFRLLAVIARDIACRFRLQASGLTLRDIACRFVLGGIPNATVLVPSGQATILLPSGQATILLPSEQATVLIP